MPQSNTYHIIYMQGNRRRTGTLQAYTRSHAISLAKSMLKATSVESAVRIG